MGKTVEIIKQMEQNPEGVRFVDLCKICDLYFGQARQKRVATEYKKLPGKVTQG